MLQDFQTLHKLSVTGAQGCRPMLCSGCRGFQTFPVKLSYKSVAQKPPTRLSYKSIPREFRNTASDKMFHPDCLKTEIYKSISTRVSPLEECLPRVSSNTRVSYKSLTRVSSKSFPQDCPAIFQDSPQSQGSGGLFHFHFRCPSDASRSHQPPKNTLQLVRNMYNRSFLQNISKACPTLP